MDIFAHALWSVAAGVVVRRTWRLPISLGWTAFWGVAPDLVTFAVPAAVRIWLFASGASPTLLPTEHSARFDWVWTVYNATHSALVFLAVFAAVYAVRRKPPVEMAAWGGHILVDVFTHRGLFGVRFLWPLSGVHFDGIRWEDNWFLLTNYVAIAVTFAALAVHQRRRTA